MLVVEIAGMFGVLVVLMGAWGFVAPASLIEFVNRWASRRGLWVAVALRFIFGLSLWLAAPHSRAPLLLQVLGAVAIVAAVTLPFMGVDRLKRFIDWWAKQSPVFIRAWCVVAVAFGGVVLWALMPAAT